MVYITVMKNFYVYIMTNKPSGVLYIGITNNLTRRVQEHKSGEYSGFAKQYRLSKLVYFEETSDVRAAIAREKQLKNWHRQWKLNLIEAENPDWEDLGKDLDPETSSG